MRQIERQRTEVKRESAGQAGEGNTPGVNMQNRRSKHRTEKEVNGVKRSEEEEGRNVNEEKNSAGGRVGREWGGICGKTKLKEGQQGGRERQTSAEEEFAQGGDETEGARKRSGYE